MKRVLIASDSPRVTAEAASILPSSRFEVTTVENGFAVRTALKGNEHDLAIVDLQIGNMGGMAICLDIRLESTEGRINPVPTLLMVDRRADVFLARRSGAQGFVIKPLDPMRLLAAVNALLEGEKFEDTSYAPTPSKVS